MISKLSTTVNHWWLLLLLYAVLLRSRTRERNLISIVTDVVMIIIWMRTYTIRDSVRGYAHTTRTRGMRYTYTRYTVYDVYNIIAHIILLICAHTAAVPTYIGPPRENLSALLLRRRDSVLTLITTGARVYR